MKVAITNRSTPNGEECAADRSCEGSGCGCATTQHTTSQGRTPQRKTVGRAGLVGLLCVLGCAAGPLAVGGFAAASGALSGEVWVIAVGLLVALAVYAHRRRPGRRGC